MLVLKFGGSSMADAGRILASARIVQGTQAQTPVTVVVSAMAGVTDTLLRVAALTLADGASAPTSHVAPQRSDVGDDGAAGGATPGWRDELGSLEARHRQTFLALGGWTPDIFALRWRSLLVEAEALHASGLDSASPAGQAAMARFSGWGERLAVDLMAHALTVCGVLAHAFADEPVILTGPRHGDHRQPGDESARPSAWTSAFLDKMAIAEVGASDAVAEPSILATRATLTPRLSLLVMRNGVPVLPGYTARDSAGRVTTLGRNGSDHSAAVIAAALGAAALYLYSDVPGLYTADPRVVPDATLLPALTYAEAGEIATLGARALHPRAVEPTARWGIPLALRSSLAPNAPGTDIIPDGAPYDSQGDALTRPERWVVAARPWVGRSSTSDDDQWRLNAAFDADDLVEVSATRLPPWPADPDDDGCRACATQALRALQADTAIQPLAVWTTPRQLRVVAPAAVSSQAQRILHAALAQAASHPRETHAGATLAVANTYEFGERAG